MRTMDIWKRRKGGLHVESRAYIKKEKEWHTSMKTSQELKSTRLYNLNGKKVERRE